MDWNDAVMEHPDLEITDKMVYHLLWRFGGDQLAVRRRIAGLLNRSERHIRRVCDKLRQCGFPLDARTPMSENGRPCPPDRTPMSETDADVRDWTSMSPPLTRARTSRSSSSEEDKYVPPLSPSPPEEGVGGEEAIQDQDDEFVAEVKGLWDRIDPTHRAYPVVWFGRLKRAFGEAIPCSVFDQFVQSGRTLASLKQPAAYQRYFETCCRNAPPAPAADTFSEADYDLDLETLYRADHEQRQATFEQEMEDFYRQQREGL